MFLHGPIYSLLGLMGAPVAAPKKTTADVRHGSKDSLDTAQLGFVGLQSVDPRTRIAGVCIVVVFGRAARIRFRSVSIESAFDEWDKPQVAAIEAEPCGEDGLKLRSEI